jgi:beta-glucanase (GH16 family)
MTQPIIFTAHRSPLTAHRSPLTLDLLFLLEISFSQIQIDPNLQPTLDKPGFNLIFNDDFGSFQPTVWNRSVPGDDLWPYSEPDMCAKAEETPLNVSNVLSPTGGILKIRVREGEDQNACDYSGGEIKSFSTDSNDAVKHWKVLPNTYLEARIKVPECEGVGGAFWLWGGVSAPKRFMEVDMIEVYGNRRSEFQANLHWGQGHLPNQPRWDSPISVGVEDLNGDDVRLSDQFLMFGVYHDNTKVELTLNGVGYRTYQMAGHGGGYNYYLRPSPFSVRLGSGSSSVGPGTPADCDWLPAYFEIDYVRLWQKAGTQAIKLTDNKISLCSDLPWGDGTNVSVPLYPGAQYTWGSTPYFNFGPSGFGSDCNCVGWWTTVVPGTPAGVYPVNLTVTFTGGYQEQVTLLIQVTSGTPPAPTNILVFNDNVQVYNFGVQIAPGTTGYEYSIDGGQTWERVPNPAVGQYNIWPKEFIEMSEQYHVYVCVRAYTNCGVSSPYCAYRTVPTSGCPYCRLTMLSPHAIFVEESSPGLYRLKVNKSGSGLNLLKL